VAYLGKVMSMRMTGLNWAESGLIGIEMIA